MRMNQNINKDLRISALIYTVVQQSDISCRNNHLYNGVTKSKTNFKYKKQ
jgi:hypothetical protein